MRDWLKSFRFTGRSIRLFGSNDGARPHSISSRAAAKAVWDVSDPKWPFRRNAKLDDSAGARARSEDDTREDRGPVVRLITKSSKGDNHVSWSSSALASCRIGVSKPSVNQL
jgi:hypothetical protein